MEPDYSNNIAVLMEKCKHFYIIIINGLTLVKNSKWHGDVKSHASDRIRSWVSSLTPCWSYCLCEGGCVISQFPPTSPHNRPVGCLVRLNCPGM